MRAYSYCLVWLLLDVSSVFIASELVANLPLLHDIFINKILVFIFVICQSLIFTLSKFHLVLVDISCVLLICFVFSFESLEVRI